MTKSSSDPQESITESKAYRQMYRITADTGRSVEQKVRDLLELGCQFLGVSAGFLTEISDGTQYIVQAYGDHPRLQSGESCPLEESYCRKTLTIEQTHTVQHARIEDWEDDAAYDAFGLESYIGAKVAPGGGVYGTFCFADTVPREVPFSEAEETFIELMAEWVGYELLTEQAIERRDEHLDRLDRFASTVSHDLRNPLNTALGYLELAEETGDPEHFESAHAALERMDGIIDKLLLLARDPEPVAETDQIHLDALARECWEFITTTRETLDIKTDAIIMGDETQVEQLLSNLFSNAVEHGGGNVSVQVGEITDEMGFYIEDDGTGIPVENEDQVFNEGFSPGEEGTGLGLAIVQQIAEAHGWDIIVTESESGGARFEITGVEFATA